MALSTKLVVKIKKLSFLLLMALSVQQLISQDAVSILRGKIGGLYSSFSGNFTIATAGGKVKAGKIFYQAPNKVHIKMSGSVLASNGRYIWTYNSSTGLCGKQDAGGASGGILGLLRGYIGTVRGSSLVFKNKEGFYDEITVKTSNGMVRSVRLKRGSETSTVSFSGIKIGAGMRASLFNYKPPPSARLIENPLNN